MRHYKKFLLSAATALEVDYPDLPTGAKIVPTSELTEYLKYIFDFGIGVAFVVVLLSLAWAGVLYFLSPAIPGYLAKAKDRVAGAISGLLILVLFYLIITTINPHLAIFKMGKLEPIDIPISETKQVGVTFYNSPGCSGESETYISSVSDLGDKLRNNVNSVGIKQDTENKITYISILYGVENFWGQCQCINPNRECSEVSNFAASSSVHQFDFDPEDNPENDGVYFFRKPFVQAEGKDENKKGGFLKISDPQHITILKLSDLRFTGTSPDSISLDDCTVPKDERDCAQYNEKGQCIRKECPKLDEQSISSIWISGDYLVLLIYFAPGDPRYGPWTYCQEYATLEDISKQGPQNIKWDAIRSKGQNPNWLMIVPIKKS